ncbi:hypothetical protein G6F35_013522 [Rhizopus arrhizus]|nr:hypothetical protein G6F35_013522 [Rhizopus arrhizus]
MYRGENLQIGTYDGKPLTTELSGNVVDVCPVGALTNKVFQFRARPWELTARESLGYHDAMGSNLFLHVRRGEVLRTVPRDNEAVNECWISDRDRFSYEGLNSDDRLSAPMIKGTDGKWQEASWADALQAVAQGLSRVRDSFGAGQIGALASEYATTEEYALLGRLVRALGSENIDFRLRQTDPAFDAALTGAPWLGMPIAELDNLDRVLVVGSFLRKDHPLMAQRLRQAAKRGTQILMVDSAADDPLMPVAARITVAPRAGRIRLGHPGRERQDH